jgi:hypothetical protein
MTRAFDRERIVFQSRVISIARDTYRAGCSGYEAERFIAQLYAQYKADGTPNLERWLARELGQHFRWVQQPPRWVAAEPAWQYAYGRPMVFIHQCTLPDNAVTKAALTWATELYVFGTRVPGDDRYKVEYRVVEQDRSG